MQIFLVERADASHAWLNKEESNHCMRVLRHQVGDQIHGVDGLGKMFLARINAYDQQEVKLTLIETHPDWGEHTGKVQVAISPLRLKDRFEWFIEKAVELGVNQIIPIQCRRTDKYKSKFKAARLETIILTALKQCKRSRLPVLHPLIPLADFLKQDNQGVQFIARGDAEDSLQSFAENIRDTDSLTLLIGPEGDFTDEEWALAVTSGYLPVSLGNNRLRTETAGIYGLGIVKMIRGF